MQSSNSILMIRPSGFGFDTETSGSNAFQQKPAATAPEVHEQALVEFDGLARVMREHGVDVHVVDDTENPAKPDAIFPNNWISTHEDGTVILYPMMSPSRRYERRWDILDELEKFFEIRRVVDLSRHEKSDRFLEGTGSMVLDRQNGVIYACRSPRTDEAVLREASRTLGYETVIFDAEDSNGQPIYHTNVMMSVGTRFAVLADFTIRNEVQRERVKAFLRGGGRRIIALRPEQLSQMAGNVLELQGRERLVAMSTKAYQSLSDSQLDLLELWAQEMHAPIPTIETVGGGSVRCMLAEIFLPRK